MKCSVLPPLPAMIAWSLSLSLAPPPSLPFPTGLYSLLDLDDDCEDVQPLLTKYQFKFQMGKS